MMDHHIFLIGMPGSGKSSLGRKVAANLRVPYVDMDRRIAELLGGTPNEIFARWGEQAFRNAETNLRIHIFGTASETSLLPASVNNRTYLSAILNINKSASLRSMYLMTACTKQINLH